MEAWEFAHCAYGRSSIEAHAQMWIEGMSCRVDALKSGSEQAVACLASRRTESGPPELDGKKWTIVASETIVSIPR